MVKNALRGNTRTLQLEIIIKIIVGWRRTDKCSNVITTRFN